jgi:hypothetical protein
MTPERISHLRGYAATVGPHGTVLRECLDEIERLHLRFREAQELVKDIEAYATAGGVKLPDHVMQKWREIARSR